MAAAGNRIPRPLAPAPIASGRARVIKYYANETKNFFKSRDRNVVTNTEWGTEYNPAVALEANCRRLVNRTVPFTYVDDDTVMTEQIISDLCILSVNQFYNDLRYIDRSVVTPEELMGSYLSILGAFCTLRSFRTAGVLRAFQNNNIDIRCDLITPGALRAEVVEIWDSYCADTGFDPANTTNYRQHMVIALGILLLLVKRLTKESSEIWFRNRWAALKNLLDTELAPESITPPNFKICILVNTGLSSHHEPRNAIFKLIRALALQPNGVFKPAFQSLVRNMWWTDMSHINLIDQYLVRENPEILSFPQLFGSEVHVLTRLYEFLGTHDQETRPFLRLLIDPERCLILNSKHYRAYTAAARAIAMMNSPNIKNIKMQFNEQYKDLAALVVMFVENKSRIGPANAAKALAPNLAPQIGDMLFNSVTTDASTGIREEEEEDDIPPLRG